MQELRVMEVLVALAGQAVRQIRGPQQLVAQVAPVAQEQLLMLEVWRVKTFLQEGSLELLL